MNIAKAAFKGVTYYNPLKADDGYTLFSPNGRTDTWLIDIHGNIVNRWRFSRIPGESAVLLPNGNLLRAQMTLAPDELGISLDACGVGGEMIEVDWDGNVVWQAEVPYQTHDFFPMDNGNILYCYCGPESVISGELAKKWKGGMPGTEDKGRIWGDGIIEINRKKEIIWKWMPQDHLDPELDSICPLEPRDNLHSNAVWKCKDGNLLFSCRFINEVIKIEYPSGKVIARYQKDQVLHQHDCRELDNGNILVFDNGPHRPGYEPDYSRVVEIDSKTDKVVWEYKANPPLDFYSSHCAGAERLPNGNTVICEAMLGRIFEVTMGGELVWEYCSPLMGLKKQLTYLILPSILVHRAHRYTRDYPGLKGKDLDPARFPWENLLYGPGAFNDVFKPAIF